MLCLFTQAYSNLWSCALVISLWIVCKNNKDSAGIRLSIDVEQVILITLTGVASFLANAKAKVKGQSKGNLL